VTHRSVLAIAVPMTLAYMTTPLLGLVDTAVVGQFGSAALLGGLAIGALVFDVVFTTFNFVRSGTTGLVAQAYGRGEEAEEQAVFWRAFAIAVVAGVALAALAPLLVAGGKWFMGAGPDVNDAMATYVGIRMLSAPFSLINYAIRARLFDRRAFVSMIALNRDIMIRSFVLLAAFALFTRQGAQLGTLILAANAVLMNFFMVAGFFLDGFATAAEQLVGRAVGARYVEAFRRAVRLTTLWGFALAALVCLATLAFGTQLIAVITTAEDVRASAAAYLPWAALTALSGVLAFQMDGIFIGATWSRDMRNMMLLSFLVFCAALYTLGPAFGNAGLWAALHVFLICRGISLYATLRVRLKTAF